MLPACVDVESIGDAEVPDGSLPDSVTPQDGESDLSDVGDTTGTDVAPDGATDGGEADVTDADAADGSDADDIDSSDTTPTGRCGNGVVEGDEQCNDGDADDTNECTNRCTFLCGNGVVNDFETCDIAIAAGEEGACPTTCETTENCTEARLEGAGCTAVCTIDPVSVCESGDGCCGTGCTGADDADCAIVCGNGVLEPGETCDPSGSCPGASDCLDDSACTVDTVVGDAAVCTAECLNTVITACANDDGCCASGCTSATDNDCSASCGDGVVDDGETCDGDCPTSCAPADVCSTARLIGDAASCNVECIQTAIVAPANGDGCCPAGANESVDNDCAAECGNGVLESGEVCDGACPGSCADADACTADSSTGSAVTCDLVCVQSPIEACANGDGCCPGGCNANNDSDCAVLCGNGVREAGEACDGDCPTTCDDGVVCTSDVLNGSADSCNVTCSNLPITVASNGDLCCPSGANATNDSDCSPVCGNGVVESGEGCDGASCPTTCASDGLACTNDAVTGSAASCDARCAYAAITACTNGDGCCASGCTAANDNDCVAGVNPASVVTSTSACLPVGQPGPAQAAIQVTLVDTLNQPISGATVTMTTTLGTLGAVTAAGNTYSAILSAPNSTTGTATVTVVANGVTLTARPAIVIAPRMGDTQGGAGSCSADGNVRVRVVDGSGAPLTGAFVMVGTAPNATAFASTFGQAANSANTATTDAQGYVTFRDFGTALDGPLTVTAAATDREYVTFTAMNASDFVLPLRQVRPSVTTTQFRGDLTGISSTGNVEAGLMLADTTLGALASFSLESLLADNDCISVPVVGNTNVPGNVYIPQQSVAFVFTIPEHEYRSAPVPYGNRFLYGLGGNLPLAALTSGDGIAAAVNQLALTNFGGANLTVSAPPGANRNIALSTALTRNVRCNLTNYPAASDVFCVAAGDLDSLASAAQRVGEGRLFLMGFRTAVTTTTTTTNVALSDLTTIDNAGAFAGIEYLSATAALYLDETRVGIPAGTANGITAIFNRTGTDLSTGTTAAPTAVAFNNYLPVRTLSRAGRVVTLGAASNTTSAIPHFTELVYNQVVDEVYSGCAANDSTRTARYPLWRVIAPATATTIALPTVPTTWPRAALAGDLQGLIDTAASPENDRIEVRASTTAERDNPSFAYDAFRFVDFVRFATHVASNVIDF